MRKNQQVLRYSQLLFSRLPPIVQTLIGTFWFYDVKIITNTISQSKLLISPDDVFAEPYAANDNIANISDMILITSMCSAPFYFWGCLRGLLAPSGDPPSDPHTLPIQTLNYLNCFKMQNNSP